MIIPDGKDFQWFQVSVTFGMFTVEQVEAFAKKLQEEYKDEYVSTEIRGSWSQ